MKTYNKEEYNKLCAEFLGDKGMQVICKSNGHYYPSTNEMKFDSDWNWIMEVVEKIESIYDDFHGYFGVHMSSNGCVIQGTKLRTNPENPHYAYFNESIMSSKKEAAVQVIWEFLNWYNNKSK